MSAAISFLAERLRAEGEKVVAFFSLLTPDQWQQLVYTEGAEWRVRNVLAHFVTAEGGLLKLFESIRNGGPGAPQDFSIDRYNASQQEKAKDLSPQDLLAQFRAVRAGTVAWVSSLADADLEKQGRHPFLGLTSLAEMIKMVFLHNALHLRDLRRIVGRA